MKKLLTMGALAFLGLPLGASAAPSAFSSQCGAITIENTTAATLMRDNEDCGLIWVLPPGSGFTQLSGFSPTGNLGTCQEVKDAQRTSARVMKRIDETSKALDELKPEYEKANAKLIAATAKLRDQEQIADVKLVLELQSELETINMRIDELQKQIAACQVNCEALMDNYKQLSAERLKKNADVRKLRAQYVVAMKAYDRALAVQKAAKAQLDAVGFSVDEVMKKQMDYHKSLHNLLLVYSRMEGGYAHLNYNTQWDEAIEELTRKYGNQFQFRKVPTKDARVFANIVGAANEQTYLSSMPAILDYSINGMKYQPFGVEREQALSALPTSLTGSLRLSLMGGCPLYFKDFLESDELKPAGTTPVSYNFGISATYKFPAAYKMNMTASYNLFKFYEKIVESSSHGGFFSSHTATSITENKVDRDMFHIDWQVEDPDSKYDEEKRQEIAKNLKEELIGRVLGTMAQPVFQSTPSLSVDAPRAGEHGAVVLAKGLQNTCGAASVWCTAGAWVLRGLDSIFGSDSATSTYRATHDRTASETWSTNTTKWNSAATVFTAK